MWGEVQSHLKIFKHSLAKISFHKLFAVSQGHEIKICQQQRDVILKSYNCSSFLICQAFCMKILECHVNVNGIFVLQNSFLRSFFLTNLVKSETGFRWRINLEALENNLPEVSSFPTDFPHQHFDGKALFVGGARSDYVR